MHMAYAVLQRGVLLSTLWVGFTAQVEAIPKIMNPASLYERFGIRYYFLVHNWTVTERERNPCVSTDPQVNTCTIMLSIRDSTDGYTWLYDTWKVPIRRSSSGSGELLSDLQKQGFTIPLSGSILVPSDYPPSTLCLALSYAYSGPSVGGIFGRWGDCNRVSAPPLHCDITGNFNIDHKKVFETELDGATASTQLNVMCSGPSSVTVTASRTDPKGVQLRSDGSLYSRITVNGKDATSGINVRLPDGQNGTLNIRSRLSSVGTVNPGPFSGSTVITVSPP